MRTLYSIDDLDKELNLLLMSESKEEFLIRKQIMNIHYFDITEFIYFLNNGYKNKKINDILVNLILNDNCFDKIIFEPVFNIDFYEKNNYIKYEDLNDIIIEYLLLKYFISAWLPHGKIKLDRDKQIISAIISKMELFINLNNNQLKTAKELLGEK